MAKVALLLQRLQQIAANLDARSQALALLGLGSVGIERERLDDFSDLDFFVIASPGGKQPLLDNLTWLSDAAPLAYHFFNTADGCKALYEDGVFCEFAVFEQGELAAIDYAPGQLVWQRPEFDATGIVPKRLPKQQAEPPSQEWLIGEALTNLLVGMQRDLRGETLSAMRFIQHYAVDRVLDLQEQTQSANTDVLRDQFSIERRFEMRFADAQSTLAPMLQGYEKNAASALAVLQHLQRHYPVNQAMADAIEQLCRAG